MKQRDKAIIDDLHRFRCMTRDDVIDLHFQGLKNPVTSTNMVLKRLRRDGHIEANLEQQPYLYFPSPSPIKKDSQKTQHFLAIVDFYKQTCPHGVPRSFIVEPKYGKDFMEPDVFMIWNGAPFFVEVQRSVYSEKVMREKIDRYERYFHSQEWYKETWQPGDRKVFPYVWLITQTRYNIEAPFRVFQSSNVVEFMQMVSPPK